MKKFKVTLIVVLFANLIHAQNPLVKQWDKRFGGTYNDFLQSFQQTSDRGYILGGYSGSDSSGDKTQPNWGSTDFWVVKIDSLGNKKWDKRFGGTGADAFFSVQQTIDAGYILGGWSYSGLGGDKTQPNWDTICSFGCTADFWVVKIDSNGNKQWDKRFGGTDYDNLFSLQQTTDGGYILGGHSISDSSGDKTQNSWHNINNARTSDYWIVKIDSLGNKQWDKRFGGTWNETFKSLQQTTDNGYILGGESYSDSSGDKTQNSRGQWDFWVVKTDSMGNKQWDKRFGGISDEFFSSVKQTIGGGYILGGVSFSDSSGDKTHHSWGGALDGDYWIVKIDSLGNKQWDKDYGGTDADNIFGYIIQTNDSDYLISGASRSPISGDKTENNLGGEQTWILKTDINGNKIWDKTIFTTGFDLAGYAIQTSDGCYAIANYTQGGIGGYKTEPNWDPANIYSDYWIIKFCDTTSATAINQISNYELPISIYPNPTNAVLNLFIKSKENIIITNLLGEIVLQSKGKGKVELDVSSLSEGIYFIRLGNEVRKFVKE